MLETNSQKIDKYLVSLVAVLVIMAVLLVFSFKGVFSSFLNASSFDPSTVGSVTRVNQNDLNEAYTWAFGKVPEKLEVR